MGKHQGTISTREMKILLKKNGWVEESKKGDHIKYKHKDYKEIITINLNINQMVARRLIKQFNLV